MEVINKEMIIQIVLCCVEEVNENLENKIDLEKGLKAHLYDWEGYLDSLGLVSLLVSIEQGLEDELGLSVDLVNLDTMSQHNSPFKTIETLVTYIIECQRKLKSLT